MKEFIDYVKANPGKLNYGSSGVGSTHHLSMESLKASLGLQLTHVPFKGTSESVPALLGGHVDVAFSAYPSLSAAVGTKNITLLATNGAARSAMAPNAPPVADFIPGFEFAPKIGIYARTGTPQRDPAEDRERGRRDRQGAGDHQAFAAAGIEPSGIGLDQYQAMLKADSERAAKTVTSIFTRTTPSVARAASVTGGHPCRKAFSIRFETTRASACRST